ncbi:MAG: hypothetical protein F7C35_03220 [Desulfurococcales archaeon]|nr:hypothetical protein [Desulfurococcales archaeon]
MVEERVLDLSGETALCGDISMHILEELDKLPPGGRLIVKTRLPREDVEESLNLLKESGIAEVVEINTTDGVTVIVLKKR